MNRSSIKFYEKRDDYDKEKDKEQCGADIFSLHKIENGRKDCFQLLAKNKKGEILIICGNK